MKTRLVATKQLRNFMVLKRRFLERVTKGEMRMFDRIFNGKSPKSSTHTLEKDLEKAHFVFCNYFQIFVWEA